MTHAPLTHRLEWSVALAGLALAGFMVWRAEDLGRVVLVVTLAVGALIAWIAVQDVRAFTISDSAILTIAVLAIAYRWSAGASAGDPTFTTCMATAIDALLPGGLLLLFREIYYRRKGFDGLGLGDVKLAAAGGLLVGAAGFSWALLAASLIALGFVGASHLLAKVGPKVGAEAGCKVDPLGGTWLGKPLGGSDRLAFGALLAPALWVVWIAQQMPMLLPYADR